VAARGAAELHFSDENEIYGHFTCDAEAEQFQWTRAQPPFSFLSLTAVDESST
jgi:hypothetical protein